MYPISFTEEELAEMELNDEIELNVHEVSVPTHRRY